VGGPNSDDWKEGLALCILCDKDEFSMSPFGSDFIQFSLVRNYLLVVHFVGLAVKYCTEYNVQIRFPLKESQGTYLLLCMMAPYFYSKPICTLWFTLPTNV
jgi:hypothetical protein